MSPFYRINPIPDISCGQLGKAPATSLGGSLAGHRHDTSYELSSEPHLVRPVYRTALALSRRHHPYAGNRLRPAALSSCGGALTSADQGVFGAMQTILAGRKCYRVSVDKNTILWPPHLETALLEGTLFLHAIVVAHPPSWLDRTGEIFPGGGFVASWPCSLPEP